MTPAELLNFKRVEDVPPEYQLAYVEAKGAEFAREHDFLSSDIARRIELNPYVELAKAKEMTAYKLNNCTPHSRHYYLDWEKLLAEKSAAEIVQILRNTDEKTEPFRRMFPFFCSSENEVREVMNRFEESEIEKGFRKRKSE